MCFNSSIKNVPVYDFLLPPENKSSVLLSFAAVVVVVSVKFCDVREQLCQIHYAKSTVILHEPLMPCDLRSRNLSFLFHPLTLRSGCPKSVFARPFTFVAQDDSFHRLLLVMNQMNIQTDG